MALVLSLYPKSSFYVDDERVTMSKIISDTQCVITYKGVAFDISDEKGVEIMPDVVVSIGDTNQWPGAIQISVQAPRERRILRGRHYLEEQERKRLAEEDKRNADYPVQ